MGEVTAKERLERKDGERRQFALLQFGIDSAGKYGEDHRERHEDHGNEDYVYSVSLHYRLG